MDEIFDGRPVRKFRKGQILVYEGDQIENIYLLVSGYVKVSNIHHNGNQRTVIIYKQGELFPMMGFLTGEGIAVYFYECLTDVEVKSLSARSFRDKFHNNLELGEELLNYAFKINQQFAERIDTLSADSARLKVIALLNYLVKKAVTPKNDKVVIDIPLTSQEIADMCSLTRETASVQLIRLKKEGVISGRRHLTVDLDKLRKLG